MCKGFPYSRLITLQVPDGQKEMQSLNCLSVLLTSYHGGLMHACCGSVGSAPLPRKYETKSCSLVKIVR